MSKIFAHRSRGKANPPLLLLDLPRNTDQHGTTSLLSRTTIIAVKNTQIALDFGLIILKIGSSETKSPVGLCFYARPIRPRHSRPRPF
jgi:hypothetical protein